MDRPVINTKPLGFPWETKDPFLFCAHHEDFYPKGNEEMGPDASYLEGRALGHDFQVKDGFRMYHGERVPGFPSHPHRGFETVTLARQGFVDHSDSLGAAGRFGKGDVQWMTAGKGVQHCEMFPLVYEDRENTLEIFQVWLNLSRSNKMVKPYFSMLWEKDIPIVHHKDEQGKETAIRLVAGAFEEQKAPEPNPDSWAADPANDVAIWTIEMEPNACFELPAARAEVNRVLYFHKGEALKVANEKVSGYHMVELEPAQKVVLENGNEKGEILMLQGAPLEEPVAQHGPFVMNYPGEIREAIQEFQQTQFGGWPWPRPDHVHEREKPRFARYPDGREETPE